MAPRVIKPDFDGFDDTDTGGSFYDGPPPKPGLYRGKIKQMHYAKIEKEGENKGKKRVDLLIEITAKGNGDKTEYAGAALYHSLNQTQQGAPFLNQFLRSLTDGSEEEWNEIRTAWWRKDMMIDDVVTVRGRKMAPIVQFGRWKPQEKNIDCVFMTKMGTITGGDRDGQERAEISRFVTPRVAGDDSGDSPEDPLGDDSEGFDDPDSAPAEEGFEDSEDPLGDDSEGFDDPDSAPAEEGFEDSEPAAEEKPAPKAKAAPKPAPAPETPTEDPDDPWG